MKKTVVLFLKNEDIFDYLTFMIRVVSISTQSLKLSLKKSHFKLLWKNSKMSLSPNCKSKIGK